VRFSDPEYVTRHYRDASKVQGEVGSI
jgi:hypothetical protein